MTKRSIIALMSMVAGLMLCATSSVLAATNYIANPSLETAANSACLSTSCLPANWNQDSWGGTTATFAWQNTGEDGTRSVSTTITNTGTGDAKWSPDAVTLPPSTSCTYSDYYKDTLNGSATNAPLNEIDVMDGTGNNTLHSKQSIPAASAWTQVSYTFTSPASGQVIFYHLLSTQAVGAQIQLDNVSVTCGSVPAPTVTLTSPTDGSTVGTPSVSLTASATNADSVAFKVDGTLIATDTTSPYTAAWNDSAAADGSTHTIMATATNATSTASSSATVTVHVTPPPTITITAPSNGATNLTGTVPFSADTGSSQGVSKVQFKVDNNLLGTDTTAPYSINWDTTMSNNGSHNLTATVVATGGTVTSNPAVNVTVNNPLPAQAVFGTNLLKNPGVENGTGGVPANFYQDSYGCNTNQFSWVTSPVNHGTHAAQVQITSYPNPCPGGGDSGDAGWVPDPTNTSNGMPIATKVTPGQTYYFSNWYQSTTDSQFEVVINLSGGGVKYIPISNPVISSTWAFAGSGPVTMPSNAVSAYFHQVIKSVGTLTTDDYYMGTYTPAPFDHGMVAFVFDDGLTSQYSNLLPMLQSRGNLPATFGIESCEVGTGSPFMNKTQITALKNEGSEIASHTCDHPDLTTLPMGDCATAHTVVYEVCEPQQDLQSNYGAQAAQDFIVPFGAYNTAVLSQIKQYYQASRSINAGYNTADNFDPYQLHSFSIYDNSSGSPGFTSPTTVCGWINYAATHHVMVMFTYHGVGQASQSPYNTSLANMSTELDCAVTAHQNQGLVITTMNGAVQSAETQLAPQHPPIS